MIYLFHGENQTESRRKLLELVNKAKGEKKDIVRLEGKALVLSDLKLALRSETFFSAQKTVVIENFFSRPSSKEKDKILTFLKKDGTVDELIFWEAKKIPGTTTRWLKGWQIQAFELPMLIFKLLDSFIPGNIISVLSTYHQCLKNQPSELIFFLLARQILNLILIKDLGEKGIGGAPWQQKKLASQANKFSLKDLLQIYKKLLHIDIDIKTGKSLMPLDWHLDLLFVSWLR